MKEVRAVIEMSGKTVFRDGRSHYKKTGIILGIVLAVTFLAGNVLGVSSSPDLHIDNLTEEYRSWHVGYFDANYVFKQTLLKDDRVTDVVSFDCFSEAWEDWLATNHEFALGDRRFFESTIQPYTCFVGIYVKLKRGL